MSVDKAAKADEQKKQAALQALTLVKPGMNLGLGTGSTANHFIRALGAKVKEGLEVKGVPTSRATAELAKELGIPLTTLGDHPFLDLCVDGADEFDDQLRLIKGGGGALLIEKIVATSAKEVVIITDETKKEMKKVLAEIQDGTFARNWILENQANRPNFNAMRRMGRESLVEATGKSLRSKMSWNPDKNKGA